MSPYKDPFYPTEEELIKYEYDKKEIKRLRTNNYNRFNNKRRRELVLDHYGGKCLCCGESRYEFLAIDHINGGGVKHLKSINGAIVYWLINNNFPNGFRVLCHNCNMALGLYGACPHSKL